MKKSTVFESTVRENEGNFNLGLGAVLETTGSYRSQKINQVPRQSFSMCPCLPE
jgi:hypothetical protein